ncbi:MAG: hypothetical protein GF320_03965 [Armatimonadia bacterium]|nr:hypothetical protein [Armatimonadia bacterium]
MRTLLLALVTAALAAGALAEPNTMAQVAFSRDGNIFVADLREGTERAVTDDGAPMGPGATTYACPTFVDRNIVMFMSWTFDDQGALAGSRLHAGVAADEPQITTWEEVVQPLGLGAIAYDQIVFLEMDGEPEDPFGAELHVSIINSEGHILPTDITTWYGDVSPHVARLRVSDEGDLITLPRWPTDVSSPYAVRDIANDRELDLIPDDLLGAVLLRSVDFDNDAAYGVLEVIGEVPEMVTGLYRLDLDGRAHQLIAQLDGAALLAVDEDEGIAIVSTGERELYVVDLQSGEATYLTDGLDPDIISQPAEEAQPPDAED